MKIIYVPVLRDTPARVHRPTGTIFLNSEVWHTIEPQVQKVILAHELGHYKLQTNNELEADKFAFENYALSEKGSLKALFRAVTKHLDMNNESHRKRATAQIIRILETDAKLGNNKAKKILETMTAPNTNALLNQLRAAHPEFSDDDLQLALYYAVSLKNSISSYSGFSFKSGGISKFFAKTADNIGNFLQKSNVQKIVSTAGRLVGIPPKIVTQGMQAIGAKIESDAEAKLAVIDNRAELARVEAERKAAELAKAEADRQAAELAKAEADRQAAEAQANADRQAAEAARVEAERKAAELAKAEADRQTAERERAEAEQKAMIAGRQRAEAEKARIEAQKANTSVKKEVAIQANQELEKIEKEEIKAKAEISDMKQSTEAQQIASEQTYFEPEQTYVATEPQFASEQSTVKTDNLKVEPAPKSNSTTILIVIVAVAVIFYFLTKK